MTDNQNFVDYVKIHCVSGNGGAGSSHFRREKFIPMGGPDGGDGGRGGHIILKGNAQLWTLLHLKFRKHIKAGHGEPGMRQKMSGAGGQDIVLEVPLGTVARDAESGEIELEITEDGEECILMNGGMGGLGNVHFKSSTNQAPTYAQPGISGKEGWKVLELKVLADVGLVGFPNAGKSTLLSVVSAAKPKIADYPFTTLKPNLGIVSYRDYKSFIMADIPGLIEGASEGKGLGHRFLRHVERNAALLFIVPIDTADIYQEYITLLNELKNYNPELLDKERILGISKIDQADAELIELVGTELSQKENLPKVVFFSSVAQMGLLELKDAIWNCLQKPVEQ